MKRIFIDNILARKLCKNSKFYNEFLDISEECENRRKIVQHDWGVFLEFIGLGNI